MSKESPEKSLAGAVGAPPPAEKTAATILKELLPKELESSAESSKPSITVGKIEELQEFLRSSSPGRILGRGNLEMRGLRYESSEEKLERMQKENASILDFLKAEPNLDSNTKRKLYHQIIEKDWKPKLEKAGRELESEIELLELMAKERTESLTEEEKGKLILPLNGENEELRQFIESGVKERERLIKDGLFCLKTFGFDAEKLKELEERFKKARNVFRKPLKKAE